MRSKMMGRVLLLSALVAACGDNILATSEPDAPPVGADARTDGPGADAMGDAGTDGMGDAALPDALNPDGMVDALSVDALNPDALNPDALSPDAVGDASVPDASGPDASIDPCAQAPVALGAAADFAVLAGPSITNTGLTVIMGDIGTSPGTSVTGFGPGVVIGTQHINNPTSGAAQMSLTTAYNDAALRPAACAAAVAGNLGGMTLTPGLYKSTSTVAVSSGDLVLDGQGDPDAVFIFQIATTLTTTVGRRVTLINSAQAANVFWQVGSSATLGTNSVMVGTIMANAAISMLTNASLDGRALARVEGVTLDTNAIMAPVL